MGETCGTRAPPAPATSCAQAAAPATEGATLMFGHPDRVATPLQPNDTLPLEHGPQGGQHVMIGIRQVASEASTWVYRVNFQQAEAPMGSSAPPVALEGSNTIAVDTCAEGWTETTLPVFMDIYIKDEAAAADISTIDGVLRVVAMKADTELAVELPVRVDID
jgi:hypothetical protein